MKRGRKLILRCVLFLVGLFLSGVGVAVTKKGELGVSPVSSVANIMSIRFPVLTLGNWLILWNYTLILGQIMILRRRFRLYQLLQVPLSFLFGYFTDFGSWLMGFFPVEIYPARLLCVILGTVILGLGIALTVTANVIMNSGEAFVKAVSDTRKWEFGTVKIYFDVSCVLLSVLLSLLLFGGTIKGTREGTVIAAFCTGLCVKFWNKLIRSRQPGAARKE